MIIPVCSPFFYYKIKILSIVIKFKTREEAKLVIIGYIETFYNCRRFHSTLGNMLPMEYECQYSYREEVASGGY